eukprot:3694063-Prymnesium_polylepis.1
MVVCARWGSKCVTTPDIKLGCGAAVTARDARMRMPKVARSIRCPSHILLQGTDEWNPLPPVCQND